MSTLEEIKEREVTPRAVLGWSNPYSDEYLSALEASHADVLKLLDALEGVEGVLRRSDTSRDNPEYVDDFNKGIDTGFEILSAAIRDAITEALA